jgi:hypothetical protein
MSDELYRSYRSNKSNKSNKSYSSYHQLSTDYGQLTTGSSLATMRKPFGKRGGSKYAIAGGAEVFDQW